MALEVSGLENNSIADLVEGFILFTGIRQRRKRYNTFSQKGRR